MLNVILGSCGARVSKLHVLEKSARGFGTPLDSNTTLHTARVINMQQSCIVLTYDPRFQGYKLVFKGVHQFPTNILHLYHHFHRLSNIETEVILDVGSNMRNCLPLQSSGHFEVMQCT